MNNCITIALQLMRRMFDSKKAVISRLVIPVAVVSAIISLSAAMHVQSPRIAYLNADKGNLGDHFIQGLKNKENIIMIEVQDKNELKSQVVGHQVSSAFYIPETFTSTLAAQGEMTVEMFELSRTEDTILLKMSADAEIERIKQAKAQVNAAGAAGDQQVLLDRLLTQQEKQAIHTEVVEGKYNTNPYFGTIVGFMMMFLLMISNGGIYMVMEDRINRTMARMYTAPVRSYEIALGNFLGNFLIGTLQVSIILLFTRYVIGFTYNNIPLWMLFIVLECFLLAAMGISSAVAGLVRNVKSLGNINNLIVTPTCMLGGCFWPVEFMPDFMQKLANFVPQKWAVDAIVKLANGLEWSDIVLNIGILLLFAGLLLSIGAYILKPSQNATG